MVLQGAYCSSLRSFYDAFYLLMLSTLSMDFGGMFNEQTACLKALPPELEALLQVRVTFLPHARVSAACMHACMQYACEGPRACILM